jgi:hypothetical protein
MLADSPVHESESGNLLLVVGLLGCEGDTLMDWRACDTIADGLH